MVAFLVSSASVFSFSLLDVHEALPGHPFMSHSFDDSQRPFSVFFFP